MLRLSSEGLDDSVDDISLVLLDLELKLHRVSFFLQPALFVVATRRVWAAGTRTFTLIPSLWRYRWCCHPSCAGVRTVHFRRLRKKVPNVAPCGHRDRR